MKKKVAIFVEIYYSKQVPRKWQLWLIGQAVKTPPSHGGNRGSIPLSAASFHRVTDNSYG